ncbi:tyrosine-type recombinase/integrase [Cellvibrio fibrivorans]|uniref:Integrase n=1 Tax=Cellvibrio fibrivorans TaxID=126350 RepID=A0ABU1UTT2_9GAMM|nr:site-specific integrase [Cellvibrio fibrivorans]MDR7088583.1 integrase [Cellvibrio fibrivorans]
MPAKVQKLPVFKYKQIVLEPLYIIFDSHGSVPVLPLLYSFHLSRFGYTYHVDRVLNEDGALSNRLVTKDISEKTIRTYIYKLSHFLRYLEKFQPSPIKDMHGSSACNEKLVNNYLNDYLPEETKSPGSMNTHLAALTSYFNWLSSIGLAPLLNLRIYRKTQQKVNELGSTEHYIKYVTEEGRLRLLNSCGTLGDKLMMRMGFEVGLRTSEVSALRVKGPGQIHELFQKMSDPRYKNRELFRYKLEGRYTKRGKSRSIYFDRELLNDMKRYFDSERKTLVTGTKQDPDVFFLRRDKRFAGTAIGPEQASRVFNRAKLLAGLNKHLCFHDLRHTFATLLFHEEISGSEGRETRSESAALIVVAQRLGHSFTRDGQAPATTTRYIRMRIEMLQLEFDGELVS